MERYFPFFILTLSILYELLFGNTLNLDIFLEQTQKIIKYFHMIFQHKKKWNSHACDICHTFLIILHIVNDVTKLRQYFVTRIFQKQKKCESPEKNLKKFSHPLWKLIDSRCPPVDVFVIN